MFDFLVPVLGFVGGVVFSFWFLVGVFLFGLLNESKSNSGWSMFFGILAVISAVGVFNLSALSSISWSVIVVGYIAIGSLYSVWRWFRHTREVTVEFNTRIATVSESDHNFQRLVTNYKDDTNYRQNKAMTGYWVGMWPFSFVTHFVGDVIIAAEKFISTFIGGIFDQISERARKNAVVDVSKY